MRKLTTYDYYDYCHEHGECLFDQHEAEFGNYKVLGGYLLKCYPEHSNQILEAINDKYGGILNLQEAILSEYEDDPDSEDMMKYIFVNHIMNFVNLTTKTRERLLKILENNE